MVNRGLRSKKNNKINFPTYLLSSLPKSPLNQQLYLVSVLGKNAWLREKKCLVRNNHITEKCSFNKFSI